MEEAKEAMRNARRKNIESYIFGALKGGLNTTILWSNNGIQYYPDEKDLKWLADLGYELNQELQPQQPMMGGEFFDPNMAMPAQIKKLVISW